MRIEKMRNLFLILFFLLTIVSCVENPTESLSNLTGQVTDIHGNPLEEVQVSILGETVYTNSQGKYFIEGIAPGSITVKFSKKNYDVKKLQLFFANGITVTKNVVLEMLGSVRGKILDKNNNPIINAKVTIIPDSNVFYTLTGYYEFKYLNPGKHTITVEKSNHIQTNASVTIINDSTIIKNINMKSLGGIKGKVHHRGIGIDNVQVTLMPGDFIIYTNYNGYYEFNYLNAGEYKLTFKKENHVTNTDSVTVIDDNITEKNIYLMEFGRLGGKVTKTNGTPLDSVKVTKFPDSTVVYTNSDGYYRFGYMEEGDYEIVFEKKYFIGKTLNIHINNDIMHYWNVELVELGSVSGTTKDENGQPLEGVRITTIPPSKEVYTNSEGQYILDHLAQGSYVIKTERDDLTTQVAKVKVENDKIIQRDFTFYNTEQFRQMIDVQGGIFNMGSDFSEDEQPVHTVTLNDFSIGKYEVTHVEFLEFLNNTSVNEDGTLNGIKIIAIENPECAIQFAGDMFYFDGSDIVETANTPVIFVTWFGAASYCNWLSEREGLEKVYNFSNDDVTINWSANGYRLPTEAEWEYAARGGQNSQGYIYSGSDNIYDVAWFRNSFIRTIQIVGQKQPNELGIYDMSGNVWEWCNDWYDDNYYSESPENNPHGPETGTFRVKRGGGFKDFANECRTTNRSYFTLNSGYFNLGFRVCKPD